MSGDTECATIFSPCYRDNPKAKLVLIALGAYADHGELGCSIRLNDVAKICHMAGCSVKELKKFLALFEKDGIIIPFPCSEEYAVYELNLEYLQKLEHKDWKYRDSVRSSGLFIPNEHYVPPPPPKASRKRKESKRAETRCTYCGSETGPFHIDHIIPKAKGGSDHEDNLTPACAPCNMSKGSKSPLQWIREQVAVALPAKEQEA